MGLAASQARELLLFAWKSDLEYSAQRITQRRIMLLDQLSAISPQQAALDETISSQLNYEDRRLELELKQLETKHKAVETEIESVKKVIDKNIEMSFKVFG